MFKINMFVHYVPTKLRKRTEPAKKKEEKQWF